MLTLLISVSGLRPARGAVDFGRFAKLLRSDLEVASGRWWDFQPDESIVISNVGGTAIDRRKQGMRSKSQPELLVFFPENSRSEVSLAGLAGSVRSYWWNPSNGNTAADAVYEGGSVASFRPPDGGSSAIRLLVAAESLPALSSPER